MAIDKSRIFNHLAAVRQFTELLCEPLEVSDFEAQASPDCSPVKWHLAHTTWFFEVFVLEAYVPGYRCFHDAFRYLFNSYYNAIGPRQLRAERGLLSRPTLSDVWAYRASVDEHLARLFDGNVEPAALALLELGCQHEQQHQELILTDVKHLFSKNALAPAYRKPLPPPTSASIELEYRTFPGGLVSLGADASGFAFDNERPRHSVYLEPFSLANRPVTNGEYAEFVDAGGYKRPEFWLDQGHHWVRAQGVEQPLYWRGGAGDRAEFTLAGLRDLVLAEPVSHLSYFEADAFARFMGARLPREAEWELGVEQLPVGGNLADTQRFHPQVTKPSETLGAVYGDVWEWTASSYGAYPGFRIADGAVGEYNGKFMCGQFVLRGGSCATPSSHIRPTYRNFFYPPDRWQFSGLRLAKDTL